VFTLAWFSEWFSIPWWLVTRPTGPLKMGKIVLGVFEKIENKSVSLKLICHKVQTRKNSRIFEGI
jgi:hypothetical protein